MTISGVVHPDAMAGTRIRALKGDGPTGRIARLFDNPPKITYSNRDLAFC
jgi:hypothetical protein